MHITDRDRDGNIQIRVEHETNRRCRERRVNPEAGDHCDVVVSGLLQYFYLYWRNTDDSTDYMEEEWEQEEHDVRFREQMARVLRMYLAAHDLTFFLRALSACPENRCNSLDCPLAAVLVHA
jgi:hypothetical protein